MAYMNQEKKKELAPAIKAACKKYGYTATVGVRNYSTLVVTIRKGPVAIVDQYKEGVRKRLEQQGDSYDPGDVTHFDVPRFPEKMFSGDVGKMLEAVTKAAYKGNHDNSDIMTDYFDVGWYVNISVGEWNKPYLAIK